MQQYSFSFLPLSPDCLDGQQKQPTAATITVSWKHKIVGSNEHGTVPCETEQALDQGQRIFKESTVESLKNSAPVEYLLVERSLRQTACNLILIKAGKYLWTNKFITGKKPTRLSTDTDTKPVVTELTDKRKMCQRCIIGLSWIGRHRLCCWKKIS